MEKRFVLFLVLAFGVLLAHFALTAKPRKPRPQADAEKTKTEDAGEKTKSKDAKTDAKTKGEAPKRESAPQIAPAKPALDVDKIPWKWVALGSADENDPYRMLVTLSSKGAAVARVELSSSRFHDLEDRSGYLGHVVVDETIRDKNFKGCPVQVVGAGTPAAEAGLEAGDIITAVNGQPVKGAASLQAVLLKTKPKQQIELSVDRDGEEWTLAATLVRRPLEIIRPYKAPNADVCDPLSLRLTLEQLNGQTRDQPSPTVAVGEEIAGLDLWEKNWELLPGATQEEARFQRELKSATGEAILRIVKTYKLAKVPPERQHDVACPAYHLELSVAIYNLSADKQTLAYQLDGPNGLPTEGIWYSYASKVSRAGGAAGLRDMLVMREGAGEPVMVNGPAIAEDSADKAAVEKPWEEETLRYIGVDTQYFAAVLVPKTEKSFAQVNPLRMGDTDPKNLILNNTSFRIVSNPIALAEGESIEHKFLLFAGPKRPDLLAAEEYRLDEVVYYGNAVFSAVARPLVLVLHVLYGAVRNYGLAIIMLTMLVRACMFPMSRKQAMSVQKMALLQPEIKKLQEKYKNDVQARHRAQQELFRKHNYNPFGGCLVMLIQLPIFIGLYRALSVDVELRQAPLIAESIRWCSNLAAPDMLYDWSWLMPGWITSGQAFYSLGPYFNLLPILTIFMFIYQQKKFMPPPADEQAAMQQKMMKYMMVFMGVLFYKVASGLCIYFIASSVFGIVERRFLPKTTPPGGAGKAETRADAKARDKAVQEATQKAAQKAAAERDRAARKKKDKNRKKRW
jgi:YidC/Oxa1 family membrane protein insertase